MAAQILFSEKGFITFGTLHRLLALMNELDVRSEAGTTIEGTFAMWTRKGVLTGVVEDVRT